MTACGWSFRWTESGFARRPRTCLKDHSMQTLLDVILPVFLVIGFGYVAVWRGFFPVAGVDGVLRFAS